MGQKGKKTRNERDEGEGMRRKRGGKRRGKNGNQGRGENGGGMRERKQKEREIGKEKMEGE